MRSFMREKKIYCGSNYREVDIFSYTNGQKTAAGRGKRSKKVKESEPKQRNLNDKNARRYFIQLGNLNFGDDPDALHVTATYSAKYLPQSIAYRVKAYDSAGAESAYTTSATRTVINNTAPTIDGADSDLGTKTGAFAQAYVVTDPDSGQTVTVVEKIDGTEKRSFTATSGQSYSFNVTAAEWVKLLNGSHTLTITATDDYGGTATRTYTFTKNETEIELTLAAPLAADDMITKAIMSVTRQIPAGATFTVEVCNNGNDASPTWEDVTQAVTSGSKFFLSNTTKTADAWGYNFRIKVKRNDATGDCFISSVGGNFE